MGGICMEGICMGGICMGGIGMGGIYIYMYVNLCMYGCESTHACIHCTVAQEKAAIK